MKFGSMTRVILVALLALDSVALSDSGPFVELQRGN